ncbi:MAG: hypothetical protein V5A68_00305 [Candidatus Thermoplasmatota archaeon]
MKEIFFSKKNCLISDEKIQGKEDKLKPEIKNINNSLKKKYDDEYASINLPDDKENLKKIKKLIEKKQELNPEFLIVAGIGGSNLGTIAVHEAINGKMYNQINPDIRVLFADTVDSDKINDIISIVEPALKKGKNVLLNGVSKSGGTTETIANFQILVNLIKKYKKEYQKYIVVTTDRNSKFWKLAEQKNFDLLEIPKNIGGRYSVFSSVGLFPLGMLKIDIEELLQGAKKVRKKCLSKNIFENPAALSAITIYLHKLDGINIHDLFLFSPDFESIGKWYRQLMAESIGKEYTKDGKQVCEGITPTVSIGSIDLHSIAQLYIGGPYDKFTTFVNIDKNKSKIEVSSLKNYSKLVDEIQGKDLQTIMDAILKGVKKTFIKGKRPFLEITLKDKSAFSIGQLLQMKMIEMMYLGFLMNVNPFNQPNVEEYKIETKKILK